MSAQPLSNAPPRYPPGSAQPLAICSSDIFSQPLCTMLTLVSAGPSAAKVSSTSVGTLTQVS
jgi:hypothetical protein